ncbi:hypothetical protein [Lelliottia amnigena]|uniref:hypothetical protein n=1 Tax=Lelliottia amnigena TaxID=61646 RepID=UPI003BA3A474
MTGSYIAATLTIPAPGKKIAASRYLRLIPFGFGSGAILHPCRSRPLGASMRLAPAFGQRLSDLQPDPGHR